MATRWRCPPDSCVGRAHRPRTEVYEVERFAGPLPALGLTDAGVEESVGHVVEDGLVLGEEELLEHEADPGGSQRGEIGVGHRGDVEAREAHRSRTGTIEGAHEVQQGGLART